MPEKSGFGGEFGKRRSGREKQLGPLHTERFSSWKTNKKGKKNPGAKVEICEWNTETF